MKRYFILIALLWACWGFWPENVAYALPTPTNKEVRVDSYTDPDGVGMYLYWCKPQGVNACVDSDFTNAQRIDVGMPPLNGTSQHVVNVLSAIPGAKGRLCFRMTAYDAAKNESAFGTLAAGQDGCGFFGVINPKNQTTQ